MRPVNAIWHCISWRIISLWKRLPLEWFHQNIYPFCRSCRATCSQSLSASIGLGSFISKITWPKVVWMEVCGWQVHSQRLYWSHGPRWPFETNIMCLQVLLHQQSLFMYEMLVGLHKLQRYHLQECRRCNIWWIMSVMMIKLEGGDDKSN